MPLTMRATGPSSPNDQRLEDFTIYSGEWAVGRIYDQRGGPEHRRWFWSLYGMFGQPAKIRTDGHASTLEEANVQFDKAWHQWLAWAKLDER